MAKRLHRAQILLEADQHQALAEFAQNEGRSISGVVRKIVAAWMTEQEKKLESRRRLAARQALQGIRENIYDKYQTIQDDLVVEVRTDLIWYQEEKGIMQTYVVIAANITLAQALPVAYTDQVMAKMDAWQRERVEIVVPTLWEYEIVEGVKGAVDRGYLTLHEGFLAVDAIFSLGFKKVHPTVELSKMALAWSGTLGAARTNDGQYLALAETLKSEFWTADENLVKMAHREGASWVQWIQVPVDVAEDINGNENPTANGTDMVEAAEG